MSKEVWLIEDGGDLQRGGPSFDGIPTMMGLDNKTILEDAIKAINYDEAKIVRYVPAPEWRTGAPPMRTAYLVECKLRDDWPWETWVASWDGKHWYSQGEGRRVPVLRWTELPDPPPFDPRK